MKRHFGSQCQTPAAALAACSKKEGAAELDAATVSFVFNGSADQAAKVQAELKAMGYQEVIIEKVSVKEKSGLEADARTARYAALDAVAHAYGATQIFLGHTRDDQAETVLLGLARGSGTRSLAGMAVINGKYARPFLQLTREQTVQACQEAKLNPWNDPHNENAKFSRVRVRNSVLPVMESEIGPGIAAIAMAYRPEGAVFYSGRDLAGLLPWRKDAREEKALAVAKEREQNIGKDEIGDMGLTRPFSADKVAQLDRVLDITDLVDEHKMAPIGGAS